MPDDPRVKELLEELLDSGGTPEEACHACPELLTQVRAGWRRLRALEAEVRGLFPEPTFSEGATPPLLPAAELPRIRGYEVQGVLGRGGAGVVYKAWHLRLNRPVAVKMLLAGPYARPEELERFWREAQAVAGLRHANLVQVHDVGDHEGRPYFTMEYVEGGSLAQKLTGTPQPAARAAALVATLAGAVQAAHRSGIVHRDLKPANVLLTADGTPKVTDFGLAKRLQRDEGLTLSGVPIGTPSYMAPEQVRGDRQALGPGADVFALGAILYELLTGRPPFRAETAAATFQQVLAEDPVPPARLNPQVPRDLETICLKCLQKDPGQRYPAAELAAELERFLKHEPIRARPPGRLERGLRWVRRRPAAAGLLAAVALLVAAVGVGAWLVYRQQAAAHARQAQTDQKVRELLGRARRLVEEGWPGRDLAKLAQARAEGNRADDVARSGGASRGLRLEAEAFRRDAAGRLRRAQRNRALLEALLEVSGPQETGACTSDGTGRLLVLAQPGVDEQYAAAFRRWGLDVDRTAEAEVVARLGAEPAPVVQELVAGLDGWMMERRRQKRPEGQWRRLFRVADRLDRSARRRRLRMLLVGEAPPHAAGVAGLVGTGSPWPALWELARGNAWRQLREVRKEIDPRKEPALTVVLLTQACAAVGDVAGAEKLLRRATTARPGQVVLLDALGKLLERQGPARLEEAIGYYRAARSRRRRLGLALSKALLGAGRAAQAEEVLQELALQRANRHNPAFYFCLGAVHMGRQRYRPAEAAYRKVLELQPGSAEAYSNLGAALNSQQEYDRAEAACRKAIALRPGFAEAYVNLGNALFHQRKHGAAEAACRKAIALRPGFAEAYVNLGSALLGQGKPGAAEVACRKAIALKPDLAEAHGNFGNALLHQEKYGAAKAAYRKALALKPDFAEVYCNLGGALNRQRKYGQAEVACRRAIRLKPGLAEAHHNLGNALNGQGKHRAAERAAQKAINLKPDWAFPYFLLGNARMGQQKYRTAGAAFRKATLLQPDFAEAYANLGSALLRQGKHRQAEAACRKAIGFKPGLSEAYQNLGVALLVQARFREATAALKKVADLLPEGASRREQVRRLRQWCQRFMTLDARLTAVLRGADKPANAAEQLEFAQLCLFKKHYAAAARFFRDAFTAEPKRAEAVPEATRYNAACAAALAGCGQGRDVGRLDDKERARWRRQALDWLRQDLAWWGKELAKGNARTNARVRKTLRHWQADSDLAGVRARDALARLPAEERKQWQGLWADVAALLRRVSGPK
jgi:serine/threonine-protein kinase